VKILIVEDDRKIAGFLLRAFTEEGYQVDVCRGGQEVTERLNLVPYDLVLLDWMLPDEDGLSVCKSLRAAGKQLPILMLTARDDVGEKVLALNAGADDYVTKPFHLAELLARVRSLLRRAGDGQGSPTRAGGLRLDHKQRLLFVEDRRVELTGREYALLDLLLRNCGRVVTRSEILDQVWGIQFDPESNVIDVHIRRLRDKLGVRSGLLDTVRGQGYRLLAEEPTP
jgi:DNA-binding response OmpR family regulator